MFRFFETPEYAMKIGIDGRFLGPRPSGNGVVSEMLIDHLALEKTDHQFVVYGTNDFDFAPRKNLRLKRMHFFHRNPYLRFLFTFSSELRRNPVDVFHALYTVPHNIRSKVVLSLIEFNWITEPGLFPANPLIRFQLGLMTRYGVRRADRIIVPTDHVRQRLLATFSIPEEKVEVVPLGVNDCFSERLPGHEIDRILKKHSITPPYLLFVGNLHPRKNVERLIQCYDIIREQEGSPCQLVLVGEKHWKHESIVGRMQSSPYQEDIRLTGYVPLEDLCALYQGAHLFVFPSLEEGFGLPPLEAMASHTPVVVSNASSVPDVVGDAALLFDPFDVTDMRRAIQEAIHNDSLRSRLVETGEGWVKNFSWAGAARKTCEIYEEVSGLPKSSGGEP